MCFCILMYYKPTDLWHMNNNKVSCHKMLVKFRLLLKETRMLNETVPSSECLSIYKKSLISILYLFLNSFRSSPSSWSTRKVCCRQTKSMSSFLCTRKSSWQTKVDSTFSSAINRKQIDKIHFQPISGFLFLILCSSRLE